MTDAPVAQSPPVPPTWVVDTNIVLDLWVFDDPRVGALREALTRPDARWLATAPMREELARVLTYPRLVRRQPLAPERAQAVLAAYDAAVTWCEPAPRARFVCSDGDDQRFIDLAVAHRSRLISKDRAVLRLARRLAGVGVEVRSAWPPPC
jgi:predicted nucleic acid-binding protein